MRLVPGGRLAAVLIAVSAAASVVPTTAAARRHDPGARRGGHVTRAWPAPGTKAPRRSLARWLARQAGPKRVARAGRPRAATTLHYAAPGSTTTLRAAAAPQPLLLLRSYAIPADDPSAARLANLSWTYDSEVGAAAFLELGDVAEAQQLLDQLAALQRVDGAIDFAFDTQSGASAPLLRSGTVAWLGLVATDFRTATCSQRYDGNAVAAARWLLARQVSDPAQTADGLILGGPDVSWASTQHNLVARAFFANLADAIAPPTAHGRSAKACAGGASGMSAAQASAFATVLRAAVARIDAAIDRTLFVRDAPGSASFREGAGDEVRASDAQALGILWLLGRGRTADAGAVAAYANAHLRITGRSVTRSAAPATYNGTFGAAGPFTGFKPYAEDASPDVLWTEGTIEMRMALARAGVSTTALDQSLVAWSALTGAAGPLQADRTITGNPFNEFHVWPSAAAGAWTLLALTRFADELG